MLEFPVGGLPRLALYGLLALWAALLVFGLILGKPGADERRRLSLGACLGMSACLLVAALLWWRVAAATTPPLARYSQLIFLGMSLGYLGDLFMSGIIVPKPRNVIFGILSFGVGHLLYILAFAQVALALQPGSGQPATLTFVVYQSIAIVLWLAFVAKPSQGLPMNLATLGYSLLIAAMGALAMALALQDAAFAPLAVGGWLFIASDLILGSEIMRGTHFRSIGDVVWITYTVAQMLIVYSSSVALHLFYPLLP